MALDYFMLRYQMQDINGNDEEMLSRNQKMPIKRNRCKDKEEQEGGLTLMVNTATAVQEVGRGRGGQIEGKVRSGG